MGYGERQVLSCTIASGASTSGAITFPCAYNNYRVQIGTMSTAVSLTLQHSMDNGTTFYNVYHPPINSSTVGMNQFVISSTAGTGGALVPIPKEIAGFQQIRFLGAAVVSGGVNISVFCSD